MVARIFAIPMTGLACMTATLAYNPGYLLVVAFDVVLAGCLVPLLAAVYWPSMTPNAGKQTMFLPFGDWGVAGRGTDKALHCSLLNDPFPVKGKGSTITQPC
jgi:hypothetical protein